MKDFLENLKQRARSGEKARIIFPEAGDERVVDAALRLKEDSLGDPIMVHALGSTPAENGLTHVVIEEEKAKELAKLLVELRGHKGMTEEEAVKLAHDPLVYGMYLLRRGEADALVAGAVHKTAEVVRPGLWLVDKESGIEKVSSAFYMLVPPFRGEDPEVLTFADCGIIEVPTADELADIAISAADARKFVVGDEPKLAFLSFSTNGSGGSGESITRMRTAIELVRKKRPDIAVADHELQGDAALIDAIAERKAPGSSVAGKANVLIFPSLDAGNIAYKLVERLVPGAKAIGPIIHGFKSSTTVHDTSRGATAEDIYHSAVIANIRSKGK
jgi:phosphate acetyltransferase